MPCEDAPVDRDGRVQQGDGPRRAPGFGKQFREDLRLVPAVPARACPDPLDRLVPATAGDQQLGPQPEELALAVAGLWQDAYLCLREHKGIGRRMLDGPPSRRDRPARHRRARRPDAAGRHLSGRAVGAGSHRMPERDVPRERGGRRPPGLHGIPPAHCTGRRSRGLPHPPGSVPGRRTGRARAPDSQGIPKNLIGEAVACGDGYVAGDVLAHPGCTAVLAPSQRAELSSVVAQRGLGSGWPSRLLADDVASAVTKAEAVLDRTLSGARLLPGA